MFPPSPTPPGACSNRSSAAGAAVGMRRTGGAASNPAHSNRESGRMRPLPQDGDLAGGRIPDGGKAPRYRTGRRGSGRSARGDRGGRERSETLRRGGLEALPHAQPHGVRRGWRRGRRGPARTIPSSMHGYDTVKGSPIFSPTRTLHRVPSSRQAPQGARPASSTGAAPGAETPDGSVSTVRAFGGMTTKRTWFATDKVGFHMLHTLFQHSMRFDPHRSLRREFCRRKTLGGRRCASAASRRARYALRRPCTRCSKGALSFSATGGGGQDAFPSPRMATVKTGDGMALAYRAGVGLKDMEFRPVSPDRSSRHRHPDHRGDPRRGRLSAQRRRRALLGRVRDYGVGQKAELGPRDMISRAIIQGVEAGRGYQGPYGEYVHLDLTHLGEAKIDSRLPFVRELARTYVGVDPGPRADSRSVLSFTT